MFDDKGRILGRLVAEPSTPKTAVPKVLPPTPQSNPTPPVSKPPSTTLNAVPSEQQKSADGGWYYTPAPTTTIVDVSAVSQDNHQAVIKSSPQVNQHGNGNTSVILENNIQNSPGATINQKIVMPETATMSKRDSDGDMVLYSTPGFHPQRSLWDTPGTTDTTTDTNCKVVSEPKTVVVVVPVETRAQRYYNPWELTSYGEWPTTVTTVGWNWGWSWNWPSYRNYNYGNNGYTYSQPPRWSTPPHWTGQWDYGSQPSGQQPTTVPIQNNLPNRPVVVYPNSVRNGYRHR